jgi:hypothetical protein
MGWASSVLCWVNHPIEVPKQNDMTTLLCKEVNLLSEPLLSGVKGNTMSLAVWEIAIDYCKVSSSFKPKADCNPSPLAIIPMTNDVFEPFVMDENTHSTATEVSFV